MKTCKDYIEHFEKLIAENISDEEHVQLKKHVDSCSDCAKLYSTNHNLSQLENPVQHASDEDFINLRLKVMEVT